MGNYAQQEEHKENQQKLLSKCGKGHFMKYNKLTNILNCEICSEEITLPKV